MSDRQATSENILPDRQWLHHSHSRGLCCAGQVFTTGEGQKLRKKRRGIGRECCWLYGLCR